MRKVAITGAAGRIGSAYAEHAASTYDLVLIDLPGSDWEPLRRYGSVHESDLLDLTELADAIRGCDTVLHLAAVPSPSATWEELLSANIVGTYNAMVAAKAAGCRRLVYASSIHAVSGYPPEMQVKTGEPVNPGDLYGVTKCFGEALGRYLAEQEGLSVVAIRIGAYQPLATAADPDAAGLADSFVSPRDLHQLIDLAIEADVDWAIAHGLSGNRFNRMDISDTRTVFGYAPVDDFLKMTPAQPAAISERTEHSRRGGQVSGLRHELDTLDG